MLPDDFNIADDMKYRSTTGKANDYMRKYADEFPAMSEPPPSQYGKRLGIDIPILIINKLNINPHINA